MFRREISHHREAMRAARVHAGGGRSAADQGKTTAIEQALKSVGLPSHVGRADDFAGDVRWISRTGNRPASSRRRTGPQSRPSTRYSAFQLDRHTVKRLWDEDSWNEVNLLVVLSGSSSLLPARG